MEREKSVCGHCPKMFTLKKNLYAHIRKVHHLRGDPGIKHTLRCPFKHCPESFATHLSLRSHVTDTHNITIISTEKAFASINEFKQWKSEEEHNAKCRFVLNSGAGKLACGDTRWYYSCHRSGQAIPKGEKRHLKSQGSVKIGRTCPSMLVVTQLNEKESIEVTYFCTHVGHKADLAAIHLTKEERINISSKLSVGESFDKILDDVRNSLDTDLQRAHLLTRKDLHNIAHQFKITHKETLMRTNKQVCCENNEMICENEETNRAIDASIDDVDEWVTQMKLTNNNPIILYKPQDVEDEELPDLKATDFMLVIMSSVQKEMFLKFGTDKICIDTIRSSTNYLQLTTVFVIDEFGEGFPVAFCLSNQINYISLSVFFAAVSTHSSKVTPKVFISDDSTAFYNAWVTIMGPCGMQLLCTSNVDRNWRAQLAKINCGPEKRVLIYNSLSLLLQEPDIGVFIKLLEEFCQRLSGDEQLQSFWEYFETNYKPRAALWAYCYRRASGININLESIKGNKIGKRIDVAWIMKLCKDKTFERIIKLTKGKITSHERAIRKSHARSQLIKDCVLKSDELSEWDVRSEDSSIYTVKLGQSCDPLCTLKCDKCNICIHSFTCNCPDALINCNICEHIHGVATTVNPQTTEIIKREVVVQDEWQTKQDKLRSLVQLVGIGVDEAATNTTKIRSRLMEKMEIVGGMLKRKECSVSFKVLEQLEKRLDAIIWDLPG